MGWRFRKSFRVFPGLRINLSKRGVSTSIGAGPLSVNLGTGGASAGFSVPGTGISFRENLDSRVSSGDESRPETVAVPPRLSEPQQQPRSKEREYASASTYELTSEALGKLAEILRTAHDERAAIEKDLGVARPAANTALARHASWESGFLLKRIRPQKFAQIKEESTTAADYVTELEAQLRQSVVSTEISLPEEFRGPFGRVCDAFAKLSRSEKIWDMVTGRDVDKARERSAAGEAVERKPVTFSLAQSPILSCDLKVPCLGNANGGDLLLYPGFVLYSVTPEQFALIAPWEIQLSLGTVQFSETDPIPADAKVVGNTWAKVNKDGSPDRRFKANFEIPLVQYAALIFESKSGLNERYLVSNFEAGEAFAEAWVKFAAAFSDVKAG
jgi:hypothetical protein